MSLADQIRARLDDPIDVALNGTPYVEAIRNVLDDCDHLCAVDQSTVNQAVGRHFLALLAEGFGIADQPTANTTPGGGGTVTEINIPEEAVKTAAERIRAVAARCCADAALAANAAGTPEDWMGEAEAALTSASPLIVAADYEQFAAKMREALRQLPEYTAGSLSWRIMNDIDTHVAELRGERS